MHEWQIFEITGVTGVWDNTDNNKVGLTEFPFHPWVNSTLYIKKRSSHLFIELVAISRNYWSLEEWSLLGFLATTEFQKKKTFWEKCSRILHVSFSHMFTPQIHNHSCLREVCFAVIKYKLLQSLQVCCMTQQHHDMMKTKHKKVQITAITATRFGWAPSLQTASPENKQRWKKGVTASAR